MFHRIIQKLWDFQTIMKRINSSIRFNHPKLVTALFVVMLTNVFLLPSACSRNPAGVDDLKGDGRIMFIRGSRDFSEICTIRPDGTDLRVIAHHDYNGEYVHQGYNYARWSPDKSRIVVEGGPRESIEWYPLWMMDMNGSLLYRLIWFGSRPIWSPDGKKIAYVRRRGYFSVIHDLYQIAASGGDEKILLEAETDTGSGYTYYAYDWFSGEKSEILLSEIYIFQDSTGKQSERPSELLAFDPASNGRRYLTDNKLSDAVGRLSPDGNYIAYVSQRTDSYFPESRVLIMTADGDSVRSLTQNTPARNYLFLAWSPDGQRIAVTGLEESVYPPLEHERNIYIIDLVTLDWDTLTNNYGDGIMNKVMDWK